jgi:hypothetical protein
VGVVSTRKEATVQAAALEAELQGVIDALSKYTEISVQDTGRTELDLVGEINQKS